jgi:cation diffusion facilitator family transporter
MREKTAEGHAAHTDEDKGEEREHGENREGKDGSFGTVLVAGAANLAIAVAKIIAGLLTGSSAMLAEGAHSVADTVNQVFLLTAIARSRKPADAQHPFGYAMERYFWSLLAAVGIFVLGAGFSIYEGIHSLRHPEPVTDLLVAYIVLGISFLFEGTSWVKAVVQLRREAGDHRVGLLRHVFTTPDPTAKTVAFEDTAALIGILLAAGGITLHHLTGSGVWDGVASILIGVLLIVVAVALGSQSKRNLIGEAMPAQAREGLGQILDDTPGVDVVVELLTMRLGPDDVLVAARVDVDDGATGADLERIADEADRRIRERYPEVRHVFLDPTAARTVARS